MTTSFVGRYLQLIAGLALSCRESLQKQSGMTVPGLELHLLSS